MSTSISRWKATLLRRIPFLLILVGAVLVAATVETAGSFNQQSIDQGQQIFQQKCTSCHTIGGGKLVGPDLQGVVATRDLTWLKEFILDPNAKFDSGDTLANQLLSEFNNVRMPNMGLTSADADSVLAYLESASGVSQPVSTPLPVAPGGAENGARLFTGQIALVNGGTPCIACHSAAGNGSLDGGSLGPDLTQVLTRYGEPGLAAALTTINFPTMIGIFGQQPLTPQETADLVEYFKQTNTIPVPLPKTGLFLGIAGGISILLFGILLIFWPRQRQSISEKLRAGKL